MSSCGLCTSWTLTSGWFVFHRAIYIHSINIYFKIMMHPCPIQWGWQYWVLSLHASMSRRTMPDRPHSLTSFFIHSDNIFLGLPQNNVPQLLVPVITNSVIDLIQDMAHSTSPVHLGCPLNDCCNILNAKFLK